MKNFNLLLLVFLLTISVHAQTDSFNRLKSDVQFLASDLLKGRSTPSTELDIAAQYLASQLEACGIAPVSDGYFQTIDLETYDRSDTDYRFTLNGMELEQEDFLFIPLGINPAAYQADYDLTFLGHGIFDPENNFNDYKNVDLKNKAGLVLLGAPWELNPHAVLSCDRAIGKAVQNSVRGANLMLYVTEELGAPKDKQVSMEVPMANGFSQARIVRYAQLKGRSLDMTPILFISQKTFNKAFSQEFSSYEKLQQDLKEGKDFTPKTFEQAVKMEVKTKMKKGSTKNIIAALKSNDPELGNEWIVLTAHYDHVGWMPVPEGNDGVFNGADDNASGTACIMEVARKLRNNNKLRRSIMIVFCTGEESGLVGSNTFTAHSPVPIDQIVLNINADMVGRWNGSLNCINSGCDALFEQSKALAAGSGLNFLPDPYPKWRLAYFIDSYNFSRLGIPFIQYMTEFHADYHQPSDEVSKINFEQLDKITDLIYEVTKSYAEGKDIPEFKRPEWFLTTK